jgi:hypothetical protein
VTLARSGELTTVKVLMNSWSCEFGGVSTGDCSTTTPGGFYTTAMKLSIWNGGVGRFTDTAPSSFLGSVTRADVPVPFRPSAMTTAQGLTCLGGSVACIPAPCTQGVDCCEQWQYLGPGPSNLACQRGYLFEVSFDFTGQNLMIPADIVWSITYHTTSNTVTIPGDVSVFTDSLNVAVPFFTVAPGSDTNPDTVVGRAWSAYGVNTELSCAVGDGVIGELFQTTGTCWSGFRPSANIYLLSTSPTE